MEARLLYELTAIVAGFACASLVAYLSYDHIRRRIITLGGNKPAEALLSWRLRNGFSFAAPVARFLLRWPAIGRFFDRAVSAVESCGVMTQREALASVALTYTVAVATAGGIAFRSIVAFFALLACCMAGLALWVNAILEKQAEAVRAAVPQALDSMSACFGSGFTLEQTFSQVASDIEGPLSSLFARSAHVLETGGTAESALAELKEGDYAAELSFIAVALDVQHQTGGSMKQVIDAAAETVKGELELKRSLRVQTAQARLSARVVAVMPLVLVTAFSLASPNFLMPFFSSVYGCGLLLLALTMMVGGIALVRRALAVEGVA